MSTAVTKFLALIIEDDKDLIDIFAAALREAGYETESVEDGREAVERLQAIVPSVVVLDLNLPHVSGEDILRQIRSDGRLTQTRIIVVTANPFWASSLRSNVDLILDKPVSYRQLRDLSARLRPS